MTMTNGTSLPVCEKQVVLNEGETFGLYLIFGGLLVTPASPSDPD